MAKKIGICTVMIILGLSVFLMAQEKQAESPKEEITAELKAKIEQFIKDLGAEDWETREAVTKALEEIGPPAEPFLKEALKNHDAEVRLRAEILLRRIEAKAQKIAYVKGSAPNENWTIWISDALGENKTKLCEAHWYTNLSWSPDGKKLAFVYKDKDDLEIRVVEIESNNVTRLPPANPLNCNPHWSPDGDRIVFESGTLEGRRDIYIMDSDGRNQTRLTSNHSWNVYPSWSPDGKRIVFLSGDETPTGPKYDLYIMNANGEKQMKLVENVSVNGYPAWSPDGGKIAFVSKGGNAPSVKAGGKVAVAKVVVGQANAGNDCTEISIIDADGKNLTRLTTNKAESLFPSWSSDGTKIAFILRREEKQEVYIIDVTQKDRQIRLIDKNKLVDKCVIFGAAYHPCYSPDGKKIVFAAGGGFATGVEYNLYIMDIDTKDVMKLDTECRGRTTAWQPRPKDK